MGLSEKTVELLSKKITSPLRYPGAKKRLAGYIAEALSMNRLRPLLFVEPFAGGAGVALMLLKNNMVEKVAFGEKDPLIASFWRIVFNDPEWLIEEIERIPVTLENWEYFKSRTFRTHRERALACIFLNRTSFSGILAVGAGPLGGRAQESSYKIDCRFPRNTLVKRIRQAASFKKRILFVDGLDWIETIKKVQQIGYKRNEVFFYLDPPFYMKAHRLYRFYFDEEEHLKLRDTLLKIKHPWLLSYDPAEAIINLYSNNGLGPRRVELLYSISGGTKPVKAQELIISNLDNLPKETRLWQSQPQARKQEE